METTAKISYRNSTHRKRKRFGKFYSSLIHVRHMFLTEQLKQLGYSTDIYSVLNELKMKCL